MDAGCSVGWLEDHADPCWCEMAQEDIPTDVERQQDLFGGENGLSASRRSVNWSR